MADKNHIKRLLGESLLKEEFPPLGYEGSDDDDLQVAADAPPGTPAEVPNGEDFVSPGVDNLLRLWQSGNKQAVALKVVGSLEKYRDFVDLLFKLGHQDALELGELMDELSANIENPEVPDDTGEIEPAPSVADVALTARESELPRFDDIAAALTDLREGKGVSRILHKLKS